MSLNTTIVDMMNAITPDTAIWWLRVLQIFGALYLFQLAGKGFIGVVELGVYFFASFKWLRDKLRRGGKDGLG